MTQRAFHPPFAQLPARHTCPSAHAAIVDSVHSAPVVPGTQRAREQARPTPQFARLVHGAPAPPKTHTPDTHAVRDGQSRPDAHFVDRRAAQKWSFVQTSEEVVDGRPWRQSVSCRHFSGAIVRTGAEAAGAENSRRAARPVARRRKRRRRWFREAMLGLPVGDRKVATADLCDSTGTKTIDRSIGVFRECHY